jgi:hypothetical protein
MVATVNVKNKPTNSINRYFYVFLTEARNVGAKSSHTPQHITLVPPITADEQIVLDVAKLIALRFRQFKIELNGRAIIGDNKDIPVVLVKPNTQLQSVHVSLFDELEKRNINTGYTRFIRQEYTPHISIKKYLPDIDENKSMVFDHIAVIHKHKATKTVLAIYKLDK